MKQWLSQLYSLSNERKRIQPMEGLRGFAVLLVFFVHFQALLGHLSAAHPRIWKTFSFLGNIGNTGVDLFFVLSGFLVYGALLRKQGSSILRFLKRRVERIYPTFLVVFAIYLLLSTFFPGENKIHGTAFSASLYILQNLLLLPGIFAIPPIITVAWSLSYEFCFYLTIPALLWLTRLPKWPRRWRVLFFIVLWFAYMAHAFTAPHSQVRLLMFVSGILLFEVVDSGRLENHLTRKGEVFAALAFIGCLILAYLVDAQPGWFSHLPGYSYGRTILPGIITYQGPYKVILLSISAPIFVLYCFECPGALQKIFTWNPLRYLGNMSYSYYLIHGLALQAVTLGMNTIFPNTHRSLSLFFFLLPISFVATWIVSTLLFLSVEKPLSLKQTTGLPKEKLATPASQPSEASARSL